MHLLLILFTSLAFAQGNPSEIRVVILGDSLTDGYGVAKKDAYPALVDQKLEAAGIPEAEIVNAGISGSTTASAAGRLKWHLKSRPQILMIALGANDGLRGMKLSETKKNLASLIETARKEGVAVLLAGMKLPPNYGKEYVAGFESIYRELAREHRVELIPFLLEGVASEKELNLADGIHPNEKGHIKMAETIYPHLLKAIRTRK